MKIEKTKKTGAALIQSIMLMPPTFGAIMSHWAEHCSVSSPTDTNTTDTNTIIQIQIKRCKYNHVLVMILFLNAQLRAPFGTSVVPPPILLVCHLSESILSGSIAATSLPTKKG